MGGRGGIPLVHEMDDGGGWVRPNKRARQEPKDGDGLFQERKTQDRHEQGQASGDDGGRIRVAR